MSLRAGSLRHRITIESQSHVQDGTTGAITIAWTSFASNLPADINPLSAREFIAAAEAQASVQGMIIIRFIAGVLPSMRARDLDTGTNYNIVGVMPDPDSGREFITLIVSAGLTAGN